ncbi:MAG: hypothetical protein IPM03_20035 [Sulfuritalea sp.]|nr:hypothetical protein [Sulfuritalea sp.]
MTHPLKARLGDKPILLMDDQFYTVGDYQLRLADVGVVVEHVATLDEALARIERTPNGYGLALLDLNMPEPKAPALLGYASELHLSPTSFNHGRCLGLHLWNQRATLELPYCYLSALPHFLGSAAGEFGDRDCVADFILDKATLLPSQLPDALVKVLEKWDALHRANGNTRSGGQS